MEPTKKSTMPSTVESTKKSSRNRFQEMYKTKPTEGYNVVKQLDTDDSDLVSMDGASSEEVIPSSSRDDPAAQGCVGTGKPLPPVAGSPLFIGQGDCVFVGTTEDNRDVRLQISWKSNLVSGHLKAGDTWIDFLNKELQLTPAKDHRVNFGTILNAADIVFKSTGERFTGRVGPQFPGSLTDTFAIYGSRE